MTSASTNRALCFGYGSGGHFLRDSSRTRIDPSDVPGFPWTIGLLDTGLLKNGKHKDIYDGRVFWTCGGKPVLWIAFFFWDRSGDSRPNSTSAFFVTGFLHTELVSAFDYACTMFPDVVARQHHPLVLQV